MDDEQRRRMAVIEAMRLAAEDLVEALSVLGYDFYETVLAIKVMKVTIESFEQTYGPVEDYIREHFQNED